MPNDPTPKNDRIARLSQRFERHALGRRPANTRARERHSLYLDTEIVGRASQAFRDTSHQLYPHTISKSVFWETLLEYALEHLDEIKTRLAETAERDADEE